MAWVNSGHSSSFSLPLRRRWVSMPVSWAIRRWTSCSFDISSEKKATCFLCFWAAFLATTEHETGLAHTRPPGNDQQVGFLQAAQQPVDVDQAGWHAVDLFVPARKLVDPVVHLAQNGLDRLQVGAHPALADAEDRFFGLIHDAYRPMSAGRRPGGPARWRRSACAGGSSCLR